MESIPLVPFGKYKGQPVTTLINDTQYLDYCKKQVWFQNYPIVYNICVNQTITGAGSSALNSKTPEHNRLQNLFLKREHINQLICFLKVKYYGTDPAYDNVQYDMIAVEFEAEFNWDVTIKNIVSSSENGNTIDYFPNIYIEIKPLMGDDYPCVLRKMKTQKDLTVTETMKNFKEHFDWRKSYETKCILLLQEFSSDNTTKEEVIAIFRQSKIRIIFVQDLFGADVIRQNQKQKKRKADSESILDSDSTPLGKANAKIQQLEQEIVLLKQQLQQQQQQQQQQTEEKEETKPSQLVMPPNIRSYFGGGKAKTVSTCIDMASPLRPKKK